MRLGREKMRVGNCHVDFGRFLREGGTRHATILDVDGCGRVGNIYHTVACFPLSSMYLHLYGYGRGAACMIS